MPTEGAVNLPLQESISDIMNDLDRVMMKLAMTMDEHGEHHFLKYAIHDVLVTQNWLIRFLVDSGFAVTRFAETADGDSSQ